MNVEIRCIGDAGGKSIPHRCWTIDEKFITIAALTGIEIKAASTSGRVVANITLSWGHIQQKRDIKNKKMYIHQHRG